MKKTLAIVLALALVFSLVLPVFAAYGDPVKASKVGEYTYLGADKPCWVVFKQASDFIAIWTPTDDHEEKDFYYDLAAKVTGSGSLGAFKSGDVMFFHGADELQINITNRGTYRVVYTTFGGKTGWFAYSSGGKISNVIYGEGPYIDEEDDGSNDDYEVSPIETGTLTVKKALEGSCQVFGVGDSTTFHAVLKDAESGELIRLIGSAPNYSFDGQGEVDAQDLIEGITNIIDFSVSAPALLSELPTDANYTVQEVVPSDAHYSVSYSLDSVRVTSTGESSITVTNTYPTIIGGSLVLKKALAGALPSGVNNAKEYSARIMNAEGDYLQFSYDSSSNTYAVVSEGSESITFSVDNPAIILGLDTDTDYTIEEIDVNGFTASYSDENSESLETVTIGSEGIRIVTVTNTYSRTNPPIEEGDDDDDDDPEVKDQDIEKEKEVEKLEGDDDDDDDDDDDKLPGRTDADTDTDTDDDDDVVQEPGGRNRERPNPNPGRTVEANENGGFTEFNEYGIPLGEWTWDDDEWVFEEFAPPLGNLAPTGDTQEQPANRYMMVFFLAGVVCLSYLAHALVKRIMR
ncbi:MAG: DUF5979 domain-containing protein [Clostridiales bacterium]|nr:DUF5979 domain-containing protein [Clostridiales bacterium]